MAKRAAGKQLTDENWDQEDEPEEVGVFSRADDDAIKGRQILKAKRRTPAGGEAGKVAFTGFGGFTFKPTQASTPVVGFGESKIQNKFGTFSETPLKDDTSDSDKNGSNTPASRRKYLSQLKDLNQSVMDWITQHVKKNPFCILTPIFKDYEKHLAELEKEEGTKESNGSQQTPEQQQEATQSQEEKEEKPVPKTGLTFGLGNLTTAKSVFGATSTTPFSGFSFKPSEGATGTGGGFSFAVGTSKPLDKVAEKNEEEEEYVPPKPEVTEHVEEDALFSKKCKLFYQKDGAWTERGVGHLHLKKADGSAQLLVRADTTLGNILLNIRLTSAIPLSRQGKNNVSMMCVPNPPIANVKEDKPIPMLIRVKTAEDADELLKQMQEIQS